MFVLTSPSFEPGDGIPRRHSREGADTSPPLAWTGVPEGTRTLALTCDDPDAPRAQPWVHWVLWGIPADARSLAEGAGTDWREGANDFGEIGWGGPLPPPGHGVHHYRFRLHALDQPLELAPGATIEELRAGMEGHVLGVAELVGTYER